MTLGKTLNLPGLPNVPKARTYVTGLLRGLNKVIHSKGNVEGWCYPMVNNRHSGRKYKSAGLYRELSAVVQKYPMLREHRGEDGI